MRDAIEAARLDLQANEAFLKRALVGVVSNHSSPHALVPVDGISVQTDVPFVPLSTSVECQTSDAIEGGVERPGPIRRTGQPNPLSLPPLPQRVKDDASPSPGMTSTDRFGQSVERNRHLAFQMDERAPGLMLLRRILEQKEENASRAARLGRNQPSLLAEAESRLMFKTVTRFPIAEQHGSYAFSPGRLRGEVRSHSTTLTQGKVATTDNAAPARSGSKLRNLDGAVKRGRRQVQGREPSSRVGKLRPLPNVQHRPPKPAPVARVQVIVLEDAPPPTMHDGRTDSYPMESVALAEKPRPRATISVVSRSVTLVQAQLRHRLAVRIAQTLQPHLSMVEKRIPVLQAHLRRMKVGLTLRQVSLLVQLQTWTRCRLSRDMAVRRYDYCYFKAFALLQLMTKAKLSASLTHRMRFRPPKPFVNLRVPTLVVMFALRCGLRPRLSNPPLAQASCQRCRPFLELMALQHISKKPRVKLWELLCSDCQPKHSKYRVKK
jgi:hypothetical protein